MDILSTTQSLYDLEVNRSSALQTLVKKFGKDSKDEINEAIIEIYGEPSSGGSVDWASRVEVLRGLVEEGKSKKDMIAHMVELEGGNKASLTQMMGYITMCQEWARQELEAQD